jgi:hypothetical protein
MDKEIVNTKCLTLAIDRVIAKAKGSKLDNQLFLDESDDIEFISEKLNITKVQAVLLSAICHEAFSPDDKKMTIAQYLDLTPMQLFMYDDDIRDLSRRGIIDLPDPFSDSYKISKEALHAIKTNGTWKNSMYSNLRPKAFMNRMKTLFRLRDTGGLVYLEFIDYMDQLFDDNPNSKLVEAFYNEQMAISSCKCLFLLFCLMRTVSNHDTHITYEDFQDIADEDSIEEEGCLTELTEAMRDEGWLEFSIEDGLKDTTGVMVTEKAKKVFLSEYKLEKTIAPRMGDLIHNCDLKSKELYFDKKVESQYNELLELLSPQRFSEIQNHMREMNFRTGFACLFYGPSGTAKTESTYQIARLTGRDIYSVEIPRLRSMWVGESEKNVKAIFTEYKHLCENSDVAPILLFNEADAILGTRIESVKGAVDKSENSIQNIILQEMERLDDGIMIATTNLASNLDKAMERRFLYKIHFGKPSSEVQKKIWQSMIPLDDKSASILSRHYSLSGGQIENVARRRMIESVLHGNDSITIDKLHEYCECERIESEGKQKIGF